MSFLLDLYEEFEKVARYQPEHEWRLILFPDGRGHVSYWNERTKGQSVQASWDNLDDGRAAVQSIYLDDDCELDDD